MLITSIQMTRRENSGTKMQGLATIILDDMIAIKEIKILCADGKYFLAMPSRPTKVGTFKDMVHPINASVREAFENLLIVGYEMAKAGEFSKIEFSLKNRQKNSLLEQTIDDFSVMGQKGGMISETNNNYRPTELNPLKNKKQDIDDSLLKWLES